MNPSPIDKMRARAWCFTINNWTDEDFKRCEKLAEDQHGMLKCRYVIVTCEVGESGTPHIQGYVEFDNGRMGSVLRKYFQQRAHLEVRKGTAAQAANYCKKSIGTDNDVKWFEAGSLSMQGKRTDLDIVGEAIIDGASMNEIAHSSPGTFIKYHKGIAALRAAILEDRNPETPPQVIWRWGKAGVGKTRYVHDTHKSVYVKDGTMWWDNYNQQEAIVIDDFDVSKWPFREMLRLIDRYAYQGQFKGGYVPINSPYIYITCEFPPEHFWQGNELAQVTRRLTLVEEVKALES